MRVLVADDSRTIRMILTAQLHEIGADEVVEAQNADEALALVDAGGIDVVLLDMHMPGASGMDVLKRLCGSTPIIVVSSDSDYRTMQQAHELGALSYIKKPFRKEELLAAIASAGVMVTRTFS